MKGKTVLITGGSQGIGKAIALRCAAAGANIVIATKDTSENMQQASEEIHAAGGQALVIEVDVADESGIQRTVAEAVARFAGIDVLVNNTSRTCFTSTLETEAQQFDAVMFTSARAAFFFSKACFPYLILSPNPHIINISPPLNLDPQVFKEHLAFSLAKYAMSLCTLGMSSEFKEAGIAVNSLWPETTIATQTLKNHFSPQVYAGSRWPSIMGDAAYELIYKPSRKFTGFFCTDEALLKEAGVKDFSKYAVDPEAPLMQALFVPVKTSMHQILPDLFLAR
ncbi:MAG: SDR family oxidoreductase [Verrucomicrobia bacterium]|nr:SDR family oxidoreductase [Verrucomicrobiota bacterium]